MAAGSCPYSRKVNNSYTFIRWMMLNCVLCKCWKLETTTRGRVHCQNQCTNTDFIDQNQDEKQLVSNQSTQYLYIDSYSVLHLLLLSQASSVCAAHNSTLSSTSIALLIYFLKDVQKVVFF